MEYGDALFVVGQAESLGWNNPHKGARMRHEGDNVWSVIVDAVPEGSNYQYVIKKDGPTKEGDRVVWLTSYALELSSRLEDCQLQEGMLVEDDTTQLVRFKISREGTEGVSVVGSIDALGKWNPAKALKLERIKGNTFEKVCAIPSDELDQFEYKFFETPSNEYEPGGNRKSDAHLVEPQREHSNSLGAKRVVDMQSVWDGLLVRLIIFHPLKDPNHHLAVSGSLQQMGGWLGDPRRMGLGNERTLLTGVKGRCWEATFPAVADASHDVQYRYCIVDPKTKTGVFEREPNRRIEMVPGAATSVNVEAATLGVPVQLAGKKGYRQREYQVFDGNFVPPNLSYDDVPPCLAIGPYPQSAVDVELMKKGGVTGVLNVQTNGDHERRMINWGTMEELYDKAGIRVIRVPIEDFNGEELARLVKEGAKAVDRMVQEAQQAGKNPKVYIHCTAGMGRAPAVACVYLVWRHGYSLQDALHHVKAHRPVSAPNWHAMEAALRQGGF